MGLGAELLEAVKGLGYTEPTEVQAKSLPPLLEGRDVLAQSRTGSGKTAAFGLALLSRIDTGQREPQAMVVCPTRELAGQVSRELRKLGRLLPGLRVLELIGGLPARAQRETLERGAHLVVGTPGRLLDHVERGFLDLGSVGAVVLDEADRLLDLGFGEQVRKLLAAVPGEHQTSLFSATFPDGVEALSNSVQHDALRVVVEQPEAETPDIREVSLAVSQDRRLEGLAWLLTELPHETALVFCNFKASVAEVAGQLSAAGVSADRLDGDLDQFQREEVLARFRNGSLRVLVATDVAGRGIDVEGLDLVLNYELPKQPEVYVHRIGRTGRAGRAGLAASLTRGSGDHNVEAIEAATGRAFERLEGFPHRAADPRRLLAKVAGAAPMTTVRIAGGRKDKLRAGDIVGALTGGGQGLGGDDVGQIEVQERTAYVAVVTRQARVAVERLNGERIKGKRFRAALVEGGPGGGRPAGGSDRRPKGGASRRG